MRNLAVSVLACALVVCGAASMANAQLVLDDGNTGGVTVDQMVATLLGDSDAIVTNVSVTGDSRCWGLFSGGNSVALGVDAGVVLSTGRVIDAVGPNVSDATTTGYGSPGDSFLDTLSGGFPTFDACILEFDFECADIDVVSFQYVFGSEEYNEYVGTAFNNVFGFELCPGAGGCNFNIATVPCNPAVPAAINNVNCGNPYNPGAATCPNAPFCDLFVCNDVECGRTFNYEMDGATTVFGVQANLSPGVNHMKLAISDAGDSVLDSWVFLEGGSFQCGGLCEPDPRSQGYWHHECLAIGEIDPGRNGRGPTKNNEEDFPGLQACADAKLEDLNFLMNTCGGMDADPPSDKCEKAKKQLTALVLNVCSDKLQNSCSVDLAEAGCESTTVGDLLEELSALIKAGDCNTANTCADLVNTGAAIPTDFGALVTGEITSTVDNPEVPAVVAPKRPAAPRGNQRSTPRGGSEGRGDRNKSR